MDHSDHTTPTRAAPLRPLLDPLPSLPPGPHRAITVFATALAAKLVAWTLAHRSAAFNQTDN